MAGVDTVNCLGPAALQRLRDAQRLLEGVAADLEALIAAIAPADTDLKRRVTLQLRLGVEQIERALDNVESAHGSAFAPKTSTAP